MSKLLKKLFILILTFTWIFSGWPQIWNFPPKIQKVRAADIALRGTPKLTGGINGANITLTFDTGAGAPQTGDVVIFFGGSGSDGVGTTKGPSTAGYTLIDITNGADVQVGAWYKVMESTPDLTVVGLGGGDTGDSVVYGAYVIDGTTLATGIFDQTATKVGQVTGVPNAPAIVTQTAGAMVIALAGGHLTDTTPGTITGYANDVSAAPNDTDDITLAAATKIVASPSAEDPAAWSSWTSANYIAISIALKPVSIVAPTVTTQAASSVEATTATGNGTITATGGENATTWGVCYKTSSPCTTADSTAAGSGTGGAGAFTASITGLTSGTIYYIKAYATNSAGTSYGSEVTILTKPAAPTTVLATDGTYTDKVTITWTKSTGATDYHVWRDSADLGAAGDVATFDDTGADTPTITAGSAAASDGTNVDYVTLSLSSASANNGTSHTYKVVASNTTGNSADSATDTGYRGVGTLTYQWQRSAADSDASYSDIVGATTASYNDTDAPSDGSGRYYKVVENATGATQQISTTDRGYRAVAVVSVSISDGVITYGTMVAGASKTTIDLTDTQTLTNDGNATEIFNIKGQNSACPWTLGATAGTDQYVHQFCKATDVSCASPPTNYTALTTSYQTLYANVAATGTRQLDLRVIVPTASSCFTSQTIDATIQATQ